MEQRNLNLLNADKTIAGETDMRKGWQTPALIMPTDVKDGTEFITPGPGGDNYLSNNAFS
jgi:hypothetical protein